MPEEILGKAIRDYRYLLNRNYSQKASIKLVGDRYMLSREARSILYRGVSDERSASIRSLKKAPLPANIRVYIDCYNVLFTLGNYLNGRPVFISDDGFLRDAGELRGRFGRKKLLRKITGILFGFFKEHGQNEYILFLDHPVSNSGELAGEINSFLNDNDITGKAETCDSPDYMIVNSARKEDIACSSDSIIIQNVPCPVFDLSLHLIRSHYDPQIMNISEFMDPKPDIH